MYKEGNIKLESHTNKNLDELSAWRRYNAILPWRKKDIVAELVEKARKREVKHS
jgi:hypothetical protein